MADPFVAPLVWPRLEIVLQRKWNELAKRRIILRAKLFVIVEVYDEPDPFAG